MRTALVLSGGGARGAYEAGIVSFLREDLGPRLGTPITFDILCGTSVGALTACALASTADRPERQGLALRELWGKLTIDEVLSFGVRDLARNLAELGGGGLASPVGLRRLLLQFDWRSIGRNLRAGRLDALSVAATRVSDGRTALFVQQAGSRQRQWWFENPHFEVVKTRIGPRHALASAAMPLVFAPVEIDDQLYLDGGLRMMVPVSPALRLGAQRVVVVSLQPRQPHAIASPEEPLLPTAAFLAGKAMNSLLQDRIDQDVENLRRINALLEAGYEAFGGRFAPAMNAALALHHDAPVRYVRNLMVRPSRDIGSIATRYLHGTHFKRRHRRLGGRLVSLLAGRESETGADLASYLLFDPGFAGELISLGRSDAKRNEEQWARFFDDTPMNDAEAAELERETRPRVMFEHAAP